ncbi:hypothetical protein DTQ70_06730 [Runella sp. SP2]|nr:hypothetical protein DTQ70_06730 [Runella sp. SP2]
MKHSSNALLKYIKRRAFVFLDYADSLNFNLYFLDTISDLQKYQDLLRQRGYAESDIENIFHKNWLRLLTNIWK